MPPLKLGGCGRAAEQSVRFIQGGKLIYLGILQAVAESVFEAAKRCADTLNLSQGCAVGVYTCRSIKSVQKPGVYAFFDSGAVYYVGEANNIARRLIREHCNAHIGGSEGVVRFLMHHLDQICAQRDRWAPLRAREREKTVKEILKDIISRLNIFVIVCDALADASGEKNKTRHLLEKCLIEQLRPALNV